MNMKKPVSIDSIIKENTGLAYKQLHRFHMADDPEAVSIAFEALWKASNDYEEGKGARFSTFATVYIYNALCNYYRSLKVRQRLVIVSYHATIDEEGDDEYEKFLASGEDVHTTVENEETKDRVNKAFNEVLKETKNGTRTDILKVWRDNAFNCSATYIAKQLGLSQSYVSQVLKMAKCSLRLKLGGQYGVYS